MARLQILELPEGNGDDRPPFLLIVDQVDDELAEDITRWPDDIAKRLGARQVLCFPGTIDIPANDTSEYLRDDARDEATDTLGEWRANMIARLNGEHAREQATNVRDKDAELEDLREQARRREEAEGIRKRVATEQKAALTDALGMDRLRDWDDIRNAATGLRRQRDAQAEAIERVRNLHRPVEHRGVTICWECSDYDLLSQTTDNSPCGIEHCSTLKALSGERTDPDA